MITQRVMQSTHAAPRTCPRRLLHSVTFSIGSMPGVSAKATAFAAVMSASLFLASEGGILGAEGPHSWLLTTSKIMGREICFTPRRT